MRDDLEVLAAWAEQLAAVAPTLGLDPGPVDWRIVEADRIYELAAVGMPGVMRHWTHGRDYWIERSRFEGGAGRLYELVVPADPPIAYLLEGNTVPAQKAVMAHVLGHVDLFRHHVLWQGRRRDVPTQLAAQERRRAAYAETVGVGAVDWVLDRAYSLADQVADEAVRPPHVPPVREDPYADLFPRAGVPRSVRTPRYRLPTADLLGFLAHASPVLDDWERDLCGSVRAESLALLPNRATKVLHEGWAAWVQTQLGAHPALPLADWEQTEQAVLWSRVVTPHPLELNPYWLGWRLLRARVAQIGVAAARAELLQETDASWVQNVLTPELVRDAELYRYRWTAADDGPGGTYWEARRLGSPDAPADFAAWRAALAADLARSTPHVWVTAVRESGQLELTHQTPSRPLDAHWTRATLRAVADLWGAPVQLQDGNQRYTSSPTKGAS